MIYRGTTTPTQPITQINQYVDVAAHMFETLKPKQRHSIEGVLEAAYQAVGRVIEGENGTTDDRLSGRYIMAPFDGGQLGTQINRAAALIVELGRRGFANLREVYLHLIEKLGERSSRDGQLLTDTVDAVLKEVGRARQVDYDTLFPEMSARLPAKAALLAAADKNGNVKLTGPAALHLGGSGTSRVYEFRIDRNSDTIDIAAGEIIKHGLTPHDWNELASRLTDDRAKVEAAGAGLKSIVLRRPIDIDLGRGPMTITSVSLLSDGAVLVCGPSVTEEHRGFFSAIPHTAWSAFAKAIG